MSLCLIALFFVFLFPPLFFKPTSSLQDEPFCLLQGLPISHDSYIALKLLKCSFLNLFVTSAVKINSCIRPNVKCHHLVRLTQGLAFCYGYLENYVFYLQAFFFFRMSGLYFIYLFLLLPADLVYSV